MTQLNGQMSGPVSGLCLIFFFFPVSGGLEFQMLLIIFFRPATSSLSSSCLHFGL